MVCQRAIRISGQWQNRMDTGKYFEGTCGRTWCLPTQYPLSTSFLLREPSFSFFIGNAAKTQTKTKQTKRPT